MEIFNIGPLELIVVLIIMFVLLGPDEMKRTSRRIAVWIRNFVRSPIWADITGMSQEIRELPKRLMEDTGLEETLQEVKQTTTAAAEEVNTAVKESVEAARIREVEHLRLNTQKLSPTAGQVIMPPKPERLNGEAASQDAETGADANAFAAAADAGEKAFAEKADADAKAVAKADAKAAVDAFAAANAYTLEVEIESTPREPAQDQPVAEVANAIVPPAEVVKKPRRKKTEAATEPAADAEGEAPAPKPRRTARKKNTPEEQTTATGSNGSGPEEIPPAKDETQESNAA